MKRSLRALALCLALLFVLPLSALSGVAATEEEIAQYERELAIYNEWKAYRAQETAYYAYQSYLEQKAAYDTYKTAIDGVTRKLNNLDYIFVTDSRGWALVGSIDIGVSVVAKYDSEDLDAVGLGTLRGTMEKSKIASDTLKALFDEYERICYSSASTFEKTKAKFEHYRNNYTSYITSSYNLYSSLGSLATNSIVWNAIKEREERNDMENRYIKLVAQLLVLTSCLDDSRTRPGVNAPAFKAIDDRYPSLSAVLEACQIIEDGNDASPSTLTFPTAEVLEPTAVEPVEKPTKPTSEEITTEPVNPAPSGSGGSDTPSGGGSDTPSGGGSETPSGGGSGTVDPILPDPATPAVDSVATADDLKANVENQQSSAITESGIDAVLTPESSQELLNAGVTSVTLSVEEHELGELVSFATEGGSPDVDEKLFGLVLDEGNEEDFRYAYFLKEGDAWAEMTGTSALVSESDEVLRRKSFYLRVDENVDDENCLLTSLPVSALPGESVRINPQCDFGYEVTDIVVWDKAGNEIVMTGTQEFIMPYGAVRISFSVVPILYHVQFFFEGALIAEYDYRLGETILPPEPDVIPQKADDENYHYTFIGWSRELSTASGDEREMKVEARFSKTPLDNKGDFEDMRGIFLKPLLLALLLVALLTTGIVFLVRFLKKKKKKQSE